MLEKFFSNLQKTYQNLYYIIKIIINLVNMANHFMHSSLLVSFSKILYFCVFYI